MHTPTISATLASRIPGNGSPAEPCLCDLWHNGFRVRPRSQSLGDPHTPWVLHIHNGSALGQRRNRAIWRPRHNGHRSQQSGPHCRQRPCCSGPAPQPHGSAPHPGSRRGYNPAALAGPQSVRSWFRWAVLGNFRSRWSAHVFPSRPIRSNDGKRRIRGCSTSSNPSSGVGVGRAAATGDPATVTPGDPRRYCENHDIITRYVTDWHEG
jgi:hypothetical protein